MTYEGDVSRRANRMLQALVVVTIALVAFWAVTGGLEDIPVNNFETVTVVE